MRNMLLTILGCLVLSVPCSADIYPFLKGKNSTFTSGATQTEMAVLAKMKAIKIPKVDFRRAGVQDVVTFLEQASIDYDTSKGPKKKKGINMVLNLKGKKVEHVTFHATRISLHDTLKIVTETLSLVVRIDGNVIMIEPKE